MEYVVVKEVAVSLSNLHFIQPSKVNEVCILIYTDCVLTHLQSSVPRPAATHVAPHCLITPLTPVTGDPGLVPTLQ